MESQRRIQYVTMHHLIDEFMVFSFKCIFGKSWPYSIICLLFSGWLHYYFLFSSYSVNIRYVSGLLFSML